MHRWVLGLAQWSNETYVAHTHCISMGAKALGACSALCVYMSSNGVYACMWKAISQFTYHKFEYEFRYLYQWKDLRVCVCVWFVQFSSMTLLCGLSSSIFVVFILFSFRIYHDTLIYDNCITNFFKCSVRIYSLSQAKIDRPKNWFPSCH